MTCERIETELGPFLDGELDSERAEEIRRHLVGCRACERKLQVLSATRESFKRLAPRPAPAGFAERCLGRIDAERAAGERPVRRGFRQRRSWGYGFAAAACLTFLLIWARHDGNQLGPDTPSPGLDQQPGRDMLSTGPAHDISELRDAPGLYCGVDDVARDFDLPDPSSPVPVPISAMNHDI